MSNVVRTAAQYLEKDNYGVFDHFVDELGAHRWVATTTDSGTATVSDAAKGILALVASDGTVADNDETYVESTNEVFKFAAGKPLNFAAKIQFTEANTDDANIAVGLLDAVAANAIVDDGAGIRTTGSGIVIYKVDGGTVWKCLTMMNGTQTISTSASTAGGSSYQVPEIRVTDYGPSGIDKIRASFYLDNQPMKDGTTGLPIYHDVTISSATEMQVFLGVKNGGANLETLNVDWVYAQQLA